LKDGRAFGIRFSLRSCIAAQDGSTATQGATMQLSNPVKIFAAAAVAAVAFGGATAAHARSDVSFSIGINAPGPVYVQPEPVYVQPEPVYAPPRVVYAPQPVYVQPAPVYVQPRVVYGPAYYGPAYYGRGYYRGHDDWRRAEWQRHEWREHHEGRGHH
jgi:hypothetical protein